MTARAGTAADVTTVGGPDGRLVPSPSVWSAVHGDRTILLDLRRERYYSLDEVGTRIWALLREGADVPAIVSRLSEEYEAPRERLEADVARLLRYLAGLRLLVLASSQRNSDRRGSEAGRADSPSAAGPLRAPSALTCALALVGVTLALRVLGLRRSLALVHRGSRSALVAETPSSEFLAGVVRKVDTAAAFFPGRALCLQQSLALYLCLRRAGVPVELRMGVQPYPFAAHAWVEYREDPVGESYDRVGKFVPFDDIQVP
jgi:hypothetical protein